jgi:glutamate/tyrosine decarboxylase-like PLP-dependent enzyme
VSSEPLRASPRTAATVLLERAQRIAARFLETVATRHVGGRSSRPELLAALGGPLPIDGRDAGLVIDELAERADAGIVAQTGPRYFGFVTGGALPVTVAADWLASTWDQNAVVYVHAPAVSVMEDVVSSWILDLLDLPRTASVGFTSGCHMANFTGLAAARHEVLRGVGWNIEARGMRAAPPIRVMVGGEVHVSVTAALRYLGFGSEQIEKIPVDDRGRMRADALRERLRAGDGATIICAQVGHVATGASDPIDQIVDVGHNHGAWVHVDGAFGLWANVVPELRDSIRGIERADSWATDAHKWLNVPYDSGLAIVRHSAAHRAAMSFEAAYLQRGSDEERVGMDWVPESSRRARVVPLYALIRTLGRTGILEMVRGHVALARRMANRLSVVPGIAILNEVALNQVLVQFDGPGGADSDALTREVITAIQAEGTCWAGGTVWQGKQALRVSISNWSTTEDDIDKSAAAIIRCYNTACANR